MIYKQIPSLKHDWTRRDFDIRVELPISELSIEQLLDEVSGTPLEQLIRECEEAEKNTNVTECSDRLVGDFLFHVMQAALETGIPTGKDDQVHYGALLSSDNFAGVSGDLIQAKRFLSIVDEVYSRYYDSPILGSLRARVKEVLDYCYDYPTVNYQTEDLQLTPEQILSIKANRVQERLTIKEKFGTPLFELDVIETLQLGLQLLKIKGGKLLTPLLNITGYGEDSKGKVAFTDHDGIKQISTISTKFLEIQKVLDSMVYEFDAEEHRKNISRIVQMVALLAVILTSCGVLSTGDRYSDKTQVANDDSDDSDDEKPEVIITAKPTLSKTPTVIPTFTATLPPTQISPTKTSEVVGSCLVGGKGESDGRPSADYLIQDVLPRLYDHTHMDKNIDQVDIRFSEPSNLEAAAEMEKLLTATVEGVVPDLCAMKDLTRPLVFDQHQFETDPFNPAFKRGYLRITPELVDEFKRAGISLYFVMQPGVVNVVTPDSEFSVVAGGINLNTDGFYQIRPDSLNKGDRFIKPLEITLPDIPLDQIQMMAFLPRYTKLVDFLGLYPPADLVKGIRVVIWDN